MNFSLGNSVGGGTEVGFYWGTKRDGSKDFGFYKQNNIGAVIGATLTGVYTVDTPLSPGGEVYTDELAGTGLDMGSSGVARPIGPVIVEAGVTNNFISTDDGMKAQITGHAGLGVSGEITASFTETISVPDAVSGAIESIVAAIPVVPTPKFERIVPPTTGTRLPN